MKDLGSIHVLLRYVTEILRFALNDKRGRIVSASQGMMGDKKTPATGCVPITGAKVGGNVMRAE